MKKQLVATAYIISFIDNAPKVFLHFHKKHQIWLGVGGHVESHENPVEAVIREAKEETGLDITLINLHKRDRIKTDEVTELTTPYTILEEKISARKNEPAHFHIDLIYFATVSDPSKLQMDEEWKWCDKEELKTLDLMPEVQHNAQKALKIFSSSRAKSRDLTN